MESPEISHHGKIIDLEHLSTMNLEHGDIIALQTSGSLDNQTMANMARSIGNFIKLHNEQFPKKQVNAIILPPKCSVSIVRPVLSSDSDQESIDTSREA